MRKKWTRENIPDLSDKIIIVTGANSGLGYQDAKAFAEKGATTILACRDMNEANNAAKKIQSKVGNSDVVPIHLDLASLDTIKSFVTTFKENYKKLDILVNNAGIMMVPYQLTEDGFESQMGINHLGHFALTALLSDLIIQTPSSRVVNVSSLAHFKGEMDFDNLLFEGGKDYSRMVAYGRSKLANLLFTYELDRRFKNNQIDSLAVAAHPGASNTKLADHLYGGPTLGRILREIFRYPLSWFLQSAAKGALSTIRAATDPNVKGGEYFGPRGLFGSKFRGYPVEVESSEASHNEKDSRMLWEASEKLTGIEFKLE